MKKYIRNIVFASFILMFSTCGRQRSIENNTLLIENDSQDKSLYGDIIKIGESYDLSQGFNSMSNQYTRPCAALNNYIIPTNSKESVVTFSDDLSEQFLRNKLDVDVSVNIPIQGVVNLTPRLAFSRDASKTNLSHTTTYMVYVELGDKKLSVINPVLFDNYENNFDSQGKLVNSSDFINKCGDQIVTAQKYSSKLVITAKVIFESISDKYAFEADLGVSPTVAPNWNLNFKISDLDISLRQRMILRLYGIQIGGDPSKLASLLGFSSCTLDDLKTCQEMLSKVSSYVANDYVKQLDPTDLNKWNIEQVLTEPYENLNFVDKNGTQLSFAVTNNFEDSLKLIDLKQKISSKIDLEIYNNYVALAMLSSNYLATDEKATLNNILKSSNQNGKYLKLFSLNCYANLVSCFKTFDSGYLDNLLLKYDPSILETNIGDLIAKVYSKIVPTSNIDKRTSDNFVVLDQMLQVGLYSSYYFKFKTLENTLLSDSSLTVDILCDFTYWFPGNLYQNVFPKYEVMSNEIGLNYKNKCQNKHPLYVANPKGFSNKIKNNNQFIVELWGRK